MSTFLSKLKIKPAFKLWFVTNGEYVFGEGTCKLLESIEEEKTITGAAKALGMSYRYAWGLVKNVEKHLGTPIVKAQKGGKKGGKTELTTTGLSLIKNYNRLKETMNEICELE
ncbi:MAG: winged helix-turn-helix domain-containing protein [Candidatus Bathyarchaeia archaeon]